MGKMKKEHFFYILYGIMGSIALAIPAANYAIDLYGVFRGVDKEIIESRAVSDRFVKMEYLLKNQNFEKYDSYLWGSSRVQKTDTMIVGEKTYNLGAPAGIPEDCLRDLKQLKMHRASIDTIYLGLDDISYYMDPGVLIPMLNRHPYERELDKRSKYYADLLTNPRSIKIWGQEKLKLRARPEGTTLLWKNGMYLVPQEIESQIEGNPRKYVREKRFEVPTLEALGGESRMRDCIGTIRQIKQFCDENHIRFVPFFNPQHMTTYLADDMELMNRFKKELVKISPFWDFSGVNYVTANNYFWYETSHPRAFICDKILDTVSGQNQITWVPDFGVYVTEENVDAFCEKAVRDRGAYDPNHEQWVPSAEERAVMTKRVNYPW